MKLEPSWCVLIMRELIKTRLVCVAKVLINSTQKENVVFTSYKGLDLVAQCQMEVKHA